MDNKLFNPFEDRLSRDIRNDLSEGFAKAVEEGNSDKLSRIVSEYRQQQLANHYNSYIEERYSLYLKALKIIHAGISEPIPQGVVLWNLGLFFEVHEVLEHAWYNAEGNMKKTLQALIRAAGVYIKKEYGFDDSAARIASKAIPILEDNRNRLDGYFKTDSLINALKTPAAPPPILGK